jgi:hypothetical protein
VESVEVWRYLSDVQPLVVVVAVAPYGSER